MKPFSLLLFLLFSFQAWSQLDFKEVKTYLPNNAQTDLKTVAVGDINNDGLNDLVIGSGFYFDDKYDYNIIIYQQTTGGELSSPKFMRYPTAYPGLKVLQIADLNNDKLNDIVIGYSDSIGIYYQLNTGGFDKIRSYYSGYTVDGLKTGDLNQDGLTDIAVSHWNSNYINIFTQKQEGGFTVKPITIMNAGYDEIDVADVNGDHLNDIVFMPGQGRQSTLQILYQDTKLGFTDSVFVYKDTSRYYPTYSGIGIGDLNNDGRNDIVGAGGGNDGFLMLMYQDSQGHIGNDNIQIPAYDIPTPVEVTDLNCDGNNEIVVGHSGWGSVTIYEKDSSGQYNNYVRYHSSYYYYPYSMAVGDLNNDHLPDIVSVDNDASFSILYNQYKPTQFDRTEKLVLNLNVTKDTTENRLMTAEPIIDSSPDCPVNRELHREITTRYANENYSGDSLTIRYATLCNAEYKDTLVNHFSYTVSKELSVDTVDTVVSTDVLYAFNNSITLGSAMNSGSAFSIFSNICWTVSVDQDWLFPSMTSGSGPTMILVAATENPEIVQRSGTVTLSGKDVPEVKVQVVQEPALPSLSTDPSSVVIGESNTATFNVLSNVNWKISNSIGWISFDKTEGKGKASVTITAQPNTTQADRSGIVFIQGDGNLTTSMGISQLYTVTSAEAYIPGGVRVFPNPFHNSVRLALPKAVTNARLELFDSRGQQVISKIMNGRDEELNTELLSRGVYILKLTDPRSIIIRKIIKE